MPFDDIRMKEPSKSFALMFSSVARLPDSPLGHISVGKLLVLLILPLCINATFLNGHRTVDQSLFVVFLKGSLDLSALRGIWRKCDSRPVLQILNQALLPVSAS